MEKNREKDIFKDTMRRKKKDPSKLEGKDFQKANLSSQKINNSNQNGKNINYEKENNDDDYTTGITSS